METGGSEGESGAEGGGWVFDGEEGSKRASRKSQDEDQKEKKDLIKHVKKSDPIGKKIVRVELEYLRSLKNITRSALNNA